MLSFPCVHALTNCLLHIDRELPQLPPELHGCLLLIQDRPHGVATYGLRQAQLLTLPLPARATGEPNLPDALQHLADILPAGAGADGAGGPRPLHRQHLERLRDRLRQPARLLAWGVCYDDLLIADTALSTVRRIDAIDVDGRSYQLTRRPGDDSPVVLIDDHPRPHGVPATQAGLSRLHAACRPHPADA